MISFFARQLHLLKVQAGSDTAICTVFPFFNDEGAVKHMLAVVPEKGLARVVPNGAFRVQRFRKRIIFDGGLWSHRKLSPRYVKLLSKLHHYDPWWLLKHSKYKGKVWAPVLKTTNCAQQFESFKDVVFDRKLKHLTYALKPDGQTLVSLKNSPFVEMSRSA